MRKEGRVYEFKICILRVGVNSWSTLTKDTLTWTHDDTYEIEPNCLYLREGHGLRVKHWAKKIKASFVVIFKEGNPQGVVYEEPERSAYTLKVVEESRALTLALKEEFKKAMSVKSLFLLVVLAIVIGVVYLVLTGQVSI
ncbi:hypothetical protein ES703_06900 [subsurface metagenome]